MTTAKSNPGEQEMVSPSNEQWNAARLLVAAFNDTDCRCDGIVLTEGVKENLKIKVAYALQQREQKVREQCLRIAESELTEAAQQLAERGDEGRDILNYTDFIKGQKTAAQDIAAAIRRDAEQEGDR